ncbi:hypothetical protein [Allosalinactinospora lopnorensis]|uniref:hypothetical protein n=1 Tax=Allosalinactinospora lopnorensis TaxID=1352348 RepID=UPI000623C116|nr:hypothetical protein [Allosalinactinospora lopnorensis]
MPKELAVWEVERWLGRAPASWEDVNTSYAAWRTARRSWLEAHRPGFSVLEALQVERAQRHAGFGRFADRGWPLIGGQDVRG